jgi:hypothetical protein
MEKDVNACLQRFAKRAAPGNAFRYERIFRANKKEV